ncbi:MAG: hypothetical protein LBE21_08085 [Pseudomonadales bacterium]|jgi:hypothetical protein|nr:hypothetical protein [Pseudomonadales bacterium]
MLKSAHRSISFSSSLFILILSSFGALAQTAGIFSNLPYDAVFLQQKLAEYSRNYAADTDPGAIPDNLFTLLALRAIVADPGLQDGLDADDVAAIAALPAPLDQGFITVDHEALSGICDDLAFADNTLAIQELAQRFDAAKVAREDALDAHYKAALNALSPATQEVIARLRQELGAARHLSYSSFDLTGFAHELPDAAQAILSHGCASFTQRLAAYTPETVTLRDQIPDS